MKKPILTLLFLSFLSFLVAQELESIIISYSPNNIVLRVDGSDVIPLQDKPNAFILDLPVGKHKIEAWAEGFEIEEYDVEITSAKVNTLFVGLQNLSSEFETHLKAKRKYRINKLKNITINSAAIGISSLLILESLRIHGINNEEKVRLESNLALAKRQYAEAINDIELAQASSAHSFAIDELKNRKTYGNIITALTIGATSLTVFRLIKDGTKEKVEKPIFIETNPFVFTNAPKTNKLDVFLMPNGITFRF